MNTAVQVIGSTLLLLSLLAALPAALLFAELIAAWTRPTKAPAFREPLGARSAALAVLMPAHDEAAGILAPIRAVLAQLRPGDRLLVVADNCSDDTARIARTAGAEVVERHDLLRRGKGHALDHGVRVLEQGLDRPVPALVIIVDADCIVSPGSLERLAQRCLESQRPVQALYLMHAPPAAALRKRIAEFAWLVKNKLRPLGAARFGWPCQLMGTGMAFPWAIIQAAPLASGHLVEDMQLGLDLAAAGTPPLFCDQALVSSVFPSDDAATTSQRTRWEHGHLSVIWQVAPRLLRQALVRGDGALLAMVLDLAVPPLAALVLGLGALLAIDAAWWALTGDARAAALSALALLLLTAGIVAAWSRDGRLVVSLRELVGIPWYVAAKLPVYARLFTKRQLEWVRTKRDD